MFSLYYEYWSESADDKKDNAMIDSHNTIGSKARSNEKVLDRRAEVSVKTSLAAEVKQTP
jgi:hypothetical protein